MKFKLEINCDNDAFHGEYGDEARTEVSNILGNLSFALVTKDQQAGNLLDVNGNFVGYWEFNDEEEDE